ncbi:MAG: alpha-L-rhamnosidase N-terminal domain-containing protein [Victivallales bacterium]|nr:alpha-L-rhamnosidase N-terminal domain-containing protein [Victivallales bacterium]
MKTAATRKWTAQWIGYPGVNLALPTMVALPAPLFRKDFELKEALADAVLYACGLGYFVCYIDGHRLTANVLQPAPTQYDIRWRYRKFQLGEIKAGPHTLCILVGNGNYHHVADDDWNFRHAIWQDYPKMICELMDCEDGEIIVKSDTSWCVCPSAITYNTLRGGEIHDARRELPLTGDPPKATHRKQHFFQMHPLNIRIGSVKARSLDSRCLERITSICSQ